MNIVYSSKDFCPKNSISFIKSKSKRKPLLLEEAIYLDCETSNNHDDTNLKSWVYLMAFVFGDDFVYLRKPSQFIECLKKIKKCYALDDKHKLIIYIHNLSYDIEYLKEFLIKEFGHDYNVLALKSHSYILFEIDSFIFKCSYKLSNRSLDKWTRAMNVEHKKLKGTIDYERIKHQQQILHGSEYKYLFNDVMGMMECLKKTMKKDGDNIQTIPLTSTGYVRREIRRRYNKSSEYKRDFKRTQINLHKYKLLNEAFAGGYTHGNRFLKSRVLKGNIRHRDFKSHYPTQLVDSLFPFDGYSLYADIQNNVTLNEIFDTTNEYTYLLYMYIDSLEIKKGVTMPYAQFSKFNRKENNCIVDNGRILKMEGGAFVAMLDIDIEIILKQYKDFKYIILEAWRSPKRKLPDYIINTVDDFYLGKSKFKEEEKKLEEIYGRFDERTQDASYNLMKSKNYLNSIYGCCVTSLIKESWNFNESGEWFRKEISEEEKEKMLTSYYDNYKSCLAYQWGCMCTALARKQLFDFIELIGYENCIYCDTDSIFYFSNDEIEKKIENENARLRKTAHSIQGLFYNEFVDENENISEFIFLHSKCYAYICDDEMKCTIAGVSSKNEKLNIRREEELKCLENLRDGFTFKTCGGTLIVYRSSEIQNYKFGKFTNELASFAVVQSTTKTLNDKDKHWHEFEIVENEKIIEMEV